VTNCKGRFGNKKNFRKNCASNLAPETAYMKHVYESSECTFAICQTPPWARNICYITLNSIPTNKSSIIPSNSTEMPER